MRKISKIAFALFLVVVLQAASLSLVSAADPFSPVCNDKTRASAACNSNTQSNPLLGPEGIITNVIQILTIIVGIAAVIMIIVGGFKYIVSTGDPQKLSNAKNTILFAIIGLVVAVMAQTIVSFVLTRL